ncbi:hypothetical protein GF312_20855, partial [Candidatus Poribacteria bacterium]|nr:hypothetical protein [Candidatus Poribacteria bacterium]
MNTKIIDEMLDRFPIHVIGNPLSLCLLENIKPEHSYEFFKKRLDCIFLMPNERYVILEDNNKSPFPKANIDIIATPDNINAVIDDRLETFSSILLHQSDIAKKIINQAYKYDIVIFIIVDGLSYFDCRERSNIIPC